MDIDIRHQEIERHGAFRAFDGEEALGSLVYVRSGPDTVLIQHTGVEKRGRGRGVGKALFEHLVEWARESGNRLTVQCPFIRKMFDKHPEASDVLR